MYPSAVLDTRTVDAPSWSVFLGNVGANARCLAVGLLDAHIAPAYDMERLESEYTPTRMLLGISNELEMESGFPPTSYVVAFSRVPVWAGLPLSLRTSSSVAIHVVALVRL